MPAPEATIQILRKDLALQLTRFMRVSGLNQVAAAKQFRVPQPTISKIVRGQVADISLELLIRISVKAGLPFVLQTGREPEEAGVFASGMHQNDASRPISALARAARTSLVEQNRNLTSEQRLASFLEHTELVSALQRAGRSAGSRMRSPRLPR